MDQDSDPSDSDLSDTDSHASDSNSAPVVTDPASILSAISKVRENLHPLHKDLIDLDVPTLHKYQYGMDYLRRVIYITAETRPDCLDKGSANLDALASNIIQIYGTHPGDRAGQFIGQWLGGNGQTCNVYPLNEKLDTTLWQADEKLVYDHLKQSGEHYARLQYAMEYKDKSAKEILRPTKIYRYFELFDGDGALGEPVAGVFKNTSPRVTNPENFPLIYRLT